jgi:hypothetical protein
VCQLAARQVQVSGAAALMAEVSGRWVVTTVKPTTAIGPKRHSRAVAANLDLALFSAPRDQLTAFFTSPVILFSSAAVSFFSAKSVGHMWPSSRFALSPKPSVAYLDLNLCALL